MSTKPLSFQRSSQQLGLRNNPMEPCCLFWLVCFQSILLPVGF